MPPRSASPTPPSAGGGSSLSKDALYAPLSTLLLQPPSSDASSVHSLAAQVPSNLRESALVDFLADVGSSLKTSRRRETPLYRSLGGSLAARGAGDADRATCEAQKTRLRDKLSNRSLVLVGGGVHSHAANRGGAATASGGGRERKRAAGPPVVGAVSGKRRKKALLQSALEQPRAVNRAIPAAWPVAKTTEVITALHTMWMQYTRQLLLPDAKRTTSSSSFDPADRRRVSYLIAAAEHVGMPATIVECLSRRHLVSVRCVVVVETKNMWRVAITRSTAHKSNKSANPLLSHGLNQEVTKKKGKCTPIWQVVDVPKQGTIMEIRLPHAVHGSKISKNKEIVVRLET